MVAAGSIVLVVMLVAGALVAIALRRVVLDDAANERHLHDAHVHTVSFSVPNGVDAADLRAAASRGGFASAVAESDTHQCLLVQCEDHDRARLRHVLEGAHDTAYHGTELDLHPVVFDDERTA